MNDKSTPPYKIYQPYIKLPLKNTFNVTRIVTILFYDLAPSFYTEGETHDFWEMVYVDRGEITAIADGNETRLRQGEVIFHRPGEFHAHKCDGTHSASVFIMTFDCRSAAMKHFCGKTAKIPAELASLMKRLIDECTYSFSVGNYPLKKLESAPIGGQQLVRIYLEALLIGLVRSVGKKSASGTLTASRTSGDNTLVDGICDYLASHVYERVTLDALSEEFHFGKSHLCDVFKKVKGDTIVQYHLKLKISEAKRLLREESLTVSEVSERLGFESPAYFSRVFRRLAGTSPRAFRGRLINTAAVYLEK